MIITLFDNKFDNLVRLGEREMSWQDFKRFIQEVEPTVAESKDEVPAAVFGEWKSESDPTAELRADGRLRRVQENFTHLHALTLDVEQRPGSPPIVLDEVLQALDGLEYVLWTTFSHLSPGKGERYRAVLPLTTPLPSRTITRLAHTAKGEHHGALLELFPFVDASCFKRLQIAYLPAIPAHPPAPYLVRAGDGEVFDWTVLPLLPEPKEVERPSFEHLSADNTGPADLRTLDLFRWFEDFGAIHGTATYGQPRIRVTCPNRPSHTNQQNDGAALLLQPDGTYGFNCFHASCADRNGMNLKRFIKRIDPLWATYCLREKALTIDDIVKHLRKETT